MTNGNLMAVGGSRSAARDESLTVWRGETLGEAVRRHWRLNGAGPVVLRRNLNTGSAGHRVRCGMAA